jgi:hypothetical protein
VQRVSIVDDARRVMEVVVEDKQLSLAIGKKGRTSAGGEADRLEDRHQERGREAQGSRGAVRRARDRRQPTAEQRSGARTRKRGGAEPAARKPRAERSGGRTKPKRREVFLATVRIYKVAELLNLSSQDVMTLLKKEHGIEVKSASSTIEEGRGEGVRGRSRRGSAASRCRPTRRSPDTPGPARGVVKKPAAGPSRRSPAAPAMPSAAPGEERRSLPPRRHPPVRMVGADPAPMDARADRARRRRARSAGRSGAAAPAAAGARGCA